MPRLAELADRVITLVTEESDIPKEAILSKSRTAEVVDARAPRYKTSPLQQRLSLAHSLDFQPLATHNPLYNNNF